MIHLRPRPSLIRPVAQVALLVLAACGRESTTPPTDPSLGRPARLEVQPAAVTLEAINDSATVTVVVWDAAGREVQGVAPTWSIDSVRVATITNGIVVARAAGGATAVASLFTDDMVLHATVPVTVAPRARTWSVVPGHDTVGVGGRLGLQMLGYDSRGTLVGAPSGVAWSTSDAAVATIDTSGLLTAHTTGTVVVTATSTESATTAQVVVVPSSGVRVSAGALNACALSPTGDAYCWGFNDQGQLGTRTSPDRCTAGPVMGSYPCALGPQRVQGGLSFRAIANGFEHTCALDAGGRAYCWGANDRGQLGSPDAADHCVAAVFGSEGPCSYTPLPVATSARFVSIGAGYRTTCGLTTDQRVLCWGNNEQGSVGVLEWGVPTYPSPTEVAGGLRYRALTVGWLHACAVATDGDTWCWGHNGSGQLGDGGWQPRFAPTRLVTERPFNVLAAGKEHTCAAAADEGPYCWGNAVGIVPTGRFASNWESAPLPTVDRTPVDTLVSGADFTCGLYGGWVRCWGTNQAWALGGPLPGGYPLDRGSLTPVALPLRASFESIAAGFSHVCGVRTGGAVYCWGEGIEGELGDGQPHAYATANEVSRPVRVSLPFR